MRKGKVAEENDFLAFHGAIICVSDATSITNGFARANFSGNTQFKACNTDGNAPKGHDEHYKKPRNASACGLPDSGWNHSPVPHQYPNTCDGNFGAGSRHFDSDRQVVNSAGLPAISGQRGVHACDCNLRNRTNPTKRPQHGR
jgi:hypothetical protein